MVRKKRIWYEGAIYHIMNRGARHMDIFQDDTDFMFFIQLTKAYLKKYNCIVHAYCLMTNHYHMLIETGEFEIWKLMKQIGQYYTEYYNSKYGTDGALFRGRYKAVLVKDDGYFLHSNRYISLNPVKAGMVTSAEFYKWSSYRTYLRIDDDGMTETGKTLGYFKGESRIRYRSFVEAVGKYDKNEELIREHMREDEQWLPW